MSFTDLGLDIGNWPCTVVRAQLRGILVSILQYWPLSSPYVHAHIKIHSTDILTYGVLFTGSWGEATTSHIVAQRNPFFRRNASANLDSGMT